MQDRLDRIEALIEALGHRVDSNARAIEANSNQIAEVDRTLAEAAGRTLRAVDELRERAEEDRVNFREFAERTDTAIAGINATLAAVNTSIVNQGRILDYLMRDQSGNGDQPQP
jgi:chromosome segregation ATPase